MVNYLYLSQKLAKLKLDKDARVILLGLAISEGIPAHPSSADETELKLYFAREYQPKVAAFLSTLNELEYVDIPATLNVATTMWNASSIVVHGRQFTYALYNPYIREIMLKSAELGFYDAGKENLCDTKNDIRWAIESLVSPESDVIGVELY